MRAKVLAIIGQIMKVPVTKLNDESSPDTVESWDSIKHMNLILALEEAFNVSFSDDEIVELLSVRLIVQALEKQGIE